MVKMNPKIIVSVTNDLYTDQRVKKVCAFLHEKGYNITLCGRVLKDSKPIIDRPYKVKRFRLLFTKGVLFYAAYNFRLFFFLLFNKADILLANDLDTLLANTLAKKMKKNCRLIYDAHEYFTGVPELENRPKIKAFWRKIEHYALPNVDEMYTVNGSIAKLYQKTYNKPIQIVRNISDAKAFSSKYSKTDLGLPLNKKIIIMQGAGINMDRGGEEAVEAIKLIDGAILIFVGNGDVIPQLKLQVINEKLTNKVLFFGKQPYDKLMNYTLHADLGLSLDKDTNVNYRFSLPNKIFDYIHAGIPLLVSDLVEVKNIVDSNHVGLVCPNHNPKTIAEYIRKIIFDETLTNTLKVNTKLTSQKLNWHNETQILENIYGY